ncbi:MAG: hypothetical protein DHS20C11_18410 [Lysobacteraceae bacterium]|nr:MAG: hypothetical protein DHS20C11_18410 [Xanthomonadaceae bacterium]
MPNVTVNFTYYPPQSPDSPPQGKGVFAFVPSAVVVHPGDPTVTWNLNAVNDQGEKVKASLVGVAFKSDSGWPDGPPAQQSDTQWAVQDPCSKEGTYAYTVAVMYEGNKYYGDPEVDNEPD